MSISTNQFERLPPHDLRAERSTLAALMLCGTDRATFEQTRALLRPDSFYQADHQILFTAVCDLADRGTGIDVTTVHAELSRRQLLEEVGGAAYLAEVLNACPSAAHGPHYAGIVRERAKLRQLIALSNDMLRRAYAPAVEDVADAMAAEFSAAAARIATTGKPHQVHLLGDVAVEVYDAKSDGENVRLPTGLRDLDRLTGGLRRGGKTVIGAKPGMGKSLLLKQLGLNLARAGVRFGVVSVEESRHKIAENAMANASGVINNRIAFGTLQDEDWSNLARGVQDLAKLPFYIIDSARRLSHVVAAARILHHEYGCEVIAVDHLHIVDGETDEHREREVSKISAELKWLWKDMGVAGIEAAQLNRNGGRERPTLASLRDSGSLEQDGDTVILLHREDYYRAAGTPADHVMEAIVAKNKNGATGTIPLHYDGARQRVGDFNSPDPFGEPEAA